MLVLEYFSCCELPKCPCSSQKIRIRNQNLTKLWAHQFLSLDLGIESKYCGGSARWSHALPCVSSVTANCLLMDHTVFAGLGCVSLCKNEVLLAACIGKSCVPNNYHFIMLNAHISGLNSGVWQDLIYQHAWLYNTAGMTNSLWLTLKDHVVVVV